MQVIIFLQEKYSLNLVRTLFFTVFSKLVVRGRIYSTIITENKMAMNNSGSNLLDPIVDFKVARIKQGPITEQNFL